MATLQEFISRVVAWPGAGSPGVVNLHWKAKGQHSDYWGGRPQRTPEDFVGLVKWALSRPQVITDMYFCLSMQENVGKSSRGKPTTARSADAALALKAIWLDIDVKAPPKGYATFEEAVRAMAYFTKAAKLPWPSALVASGGGLHVYWISQTPLTVDEWRPYAEGLKAAAIQHGLRCDAGLTTDCARILRVPETFNYKSQPPNPVKLVELGNDYDFSQSLAHIAIDPATVITATVISAEPPFDLSQFQGKKPAAAFAHLDAKDSLSAGIGHEDIPLDPRPIILGCPFFKDAFKTHGKDHTQPLWNLAILATTFWEKGDVLAHEIGNAHPGYTTSSTDAMYQRKFRERTTKGLGWPSCKAIEGEGCKLCAGCPHFGKIKSPLNLATSPSQPYVSPLTVTPQLVAATNAAANLSLPEGFGVDPKTGFISAIMEIELGDRGSPLTKMINLFRCVIQNPWAQQTPRRGLNFTAQLDKDTWEDIFIPVETTATTSELMRCLAKQGVLVNTAAEPKIREFVVHWLGKMNLESGALKSQPFGWVIENDGGKVDGFSYGGKTFWRADSKTNLAPLPTKAGFGDPRLRDQYQPTGTIDPWYEALHNITSQNRPDLETIAITGFAGPLLHSVGKQMTFYSAFGESGANKSSAMTLAMAIWGHPVKTKETIKSTTKGVVDKMGQLCNIPLFWDEIKDKDVQKHVYDVIFIGHEGVQGSRLNSDGSQKDKGMWQTSLSMNSNISFVDYVAERQHSTDAGVYRVYEHYVKRVPKDHPGQISDLDASRLFANLQHNFGHMGEKYAQLLAYDPAAIDRMVKDQTEQFVKRTGAQTAERNWVAACTTIIVGAELANMLGCNFHAEGVYEHLLKNFYKMRSRVKSNASEGGSYDNSESVLLQWLNASGGNTIWTEGMNTQRGKPRAVVMIRRPRDTEAPIFNQFSVSAKTLLVSRTNFIEWLVKTERSPFVIQEGLHNHFAVEDIRATIGTGTEIRKMPEALLKFPIPDDSVLAPMLYAHSTVKPETVVEIETEDRTVPTGIEAAVKVAANDLEVVKKATA